MTTLQQIAWTMHVHHWRYTHTDKPSLMTRNLLMALQHTFSEVVTKLLERGDRLPDSAWREYQ